jgi:hypothetical protein
MASSPKCDYPPILIQAPGFVRHTLRGLALASRGRKSPGIGPWYAWEMAYQLLGGNLVGHSAIHPCYILRKVLPFLKVEIMN